MFSTTTQRRTAVVIGLLLLVGCSSPQNGPASTTPVGTAAAQQVMGVYGRAEMPTAPFADAAVTIFRLDNEAQVGQGRTNSDGSYGIAVEAGLPEGLPLRVVATKDGKTLGALGTARMVAKDVVRSVMQAEERETNLTLASTLALAAFVKRMKAVSMTLVVPNTNRINFQALNKLLEMYAKAKTAAAATIAQYRTVPGGGGSGGSGGSRPIEDVITSVLGPSGTGTLPQEVANAITPPGSPMAEVSGEVTRLTQEAAALASQENGTVVQVEAETFGQVVLAPVAASPPPTAPSQPASAAPVTPPATTAPSAAPVATPTPKPTNGGGTSRPPVAASPVFAQVGFGLVGQLPLAKSLPGASTFTLGGNWNMPGAASAPTHTVTFALPAGLPAQGTTTPTNLTLNAPVGVPTRAAATETSVGLTVEARQPGRASSTGTSVSFGSPLGVPVPKPTPTPTP